jgi:hypothetical protein
LKDSNQRRNCKKRREKNRDQNMMVQKEGQVRIEGTSKTFRVTAEWLKQ